MEKQILFILEKSSMVANALIQGLEEASFTVVRTRASVAEISCLNNRPGLWLLYLQGVDAPLTDLLSYARSQVKGHGVKLFAVGTPDELAEILRGFPRDCLAGTFTRPFRVDELIERLAMEAISEDPSAESKVEETKRILVVDDDTVMLQSLKELLSPSYRVYTANSGMNAIQMLVNTEVDLILLDYEMPVVKGPQIFEMLKNEPHTKDIPVMFLTSKNDKDSIMKVMSLGRGKRRVYTSDNGSDSMTEVASTGPVDYMLKSLPQSEILERIRAFFEGGPGEDGSA